MMEIEQYRDSEPFYGYTRTYTFLGVDPASGVYQTATDLVQVRIHPGIQEVFQIAIRYRDFALHFFIQCVPKHFAKNYIYQFADPGTIGYGGGNQPVAVLDRWQKSGRQGPGAKVCSTSLR